MANKQKTVMVVDGQGGGLGKSIIERIKKSNLRVTVIGVGTNSIATGTMLKAGADDAATGENAVIYNAGLADYIVGPIGILSANSMLGEISPAVAAAIAAAPGPKLLIPLNKCNLYIAGVRENGLNDKIDDVIARIAADPEG
ncbi:MAG: DUF3842 family protein [Clostridiales Family XIII bacterium]|jgi:NAD(P)-dependent dehydrogenase (short-subunit alcohol dehydrogenase family)|nr:DUF3842 family protein [Clostridiales Family XIII bacterium]